MTQKQRQPLSENTKKALIIGAIILAAVIALSVALPLMLRTDKVPATQERPDANSSTLPVKNGDFMYASSDDTSYPKSALNWTKYTYKDVEGSSHDFTAIDTTEKSVLGIVDTDDWTTVSSDLALEGITAANPSYPNSEATDKNVYMIASKQATSASILSDSVSISAGTSVKITVNLNTEQLTSGTAVIMIQKSTVSAKSENWYAYNFEIGKADGWQSYEFYIFNRESSTKYVRCSIGLGNVYGGENEDGEITAEGIIFADEITYETVTADDFRIYADGEGSNPYKIIENEDITADSQYVELATEDGTAVETFTASKQYVDEAGVSPFTDRDDFTNDDGEASGFTIYKMSGNGSSTDAIALRLSTTIKVLADEVNKDHHHISFWVRVNQLNKVAKANIYVQQLNDEGEFENVTNGSFANISTSQDIDDDQNCGWIKCEVYLKPSTVETEISLLFVLGNKDGYTDDDIANGLVPNGDMYVTSPSYETISYTDYSNASTGSYVKKINLVGTSATTSVTNGSFSDLDNTGTRPANWTPAFAGDNSIYLDGKGTTVELDRLASDVEGSGTLKNWESAPAFDDEQHNVLQIVNNTQTSFGFVSGSLSLSAHSVYVVSVLAKTGDLNPYIYLLDADKDRDNAIIAQVTSKYAAGTEIDASLLGQATESADEGEGWTRYFIVYVTGDEAVTARIALFNGSIDGANKVAGTVYYDDVELITLGGYSLDEDEDNEDATEYVVNWTTNYAKDYSELKEDGDLAAVAVAEPTEAEWTEMKTIPAEEEEGDDSDTDDATTTDSDVDLGLLFSVISSVALVAALLVVIVIKIFKNKKKSNA